MAAALPYDRLSPCIVKITGMLLFGWAAILSASCSNDSQNAKIGSNLDAMDTAVIQIKNQGFQVWLATTPEQQERGLMQTPEEQLAPVTHPEEASLPVLERGMLFVFTSERPLSFWMYNTITALDIAYISSDGRIVKTYTMAPLETRQYPSIEPARMALEVRAGTFERLGIAPGDQVEIPESILKGTARSVESTSR